MATNRNSRIFRTYDPNNVPLPAPDLPPLGESGRFIPPTPEMVDLNPQPAHPPPPTFRTNENDVTVRPVPQGGGRQFVGPSQQPNIPAYTGQSQFAGWYNGRGYQTMPGGGRPTMIPHAQPARDRTGNFLGNLFSLGAGAAGAGPLGMAVRPLGGVASRLFREWQMRRNAPENTLTAQQVGRGGRGNRVATSPQGQIPRATLANPGGRQAFAAPAPISGGTWGGTYQPGTALAGLLNQGPAYRGRAPAAQGMGGSDFRSMGHSALTKNRDKGDTPHRNGVPIVRPVILPSAITGGPMVNTSVGPDGSMDWIGNPATAMAGPQLPQAGSDLASRLAAIRQLWRERSVGGG